jgi:D-lactate dehydrogenase
LCAQRCPVGINTGELVKKLRARNADHVKTADWLANHFATTAARRALYPACGQRRAHALGAPRLARNYLPP